MHEIIKFRKWYKFYVSGRGGMNDWISEFSPSHYNNFVAKHIDKRKLISKNPFSRGDELKLASKQSYYDILRNATESGNVSPKDRYLLQQHYRKMKKMSLIEEIHSNKEEGIGDSSQQEKELKKILEREAEEEDERAGEDLMEGQQFCQYFFSAILVSLLHD